MVLKIFILDVLRVTGDVRIVLTSIATNITRSGDFS